MTGKWNDEVGKIIIDATAAAREFGHAYIGSEHILLAITRTKPKCFDGTPITFENIRSHLSELACRGTEDFTGGEEFTPKCRRILNDAEFFAHDTGYSEITVTHIIMSILANECVAKRIIEAEGVSVNDITAKLGASIKSGTKKSVRKPTPMLDKYGNDITAAAKAGKILAVGGRENEVEQIVRILLRRLKSNPLLIGEAGVGKTAIAEYFAYRIVTGNVPEALADMRLISLDMAGIVAGTKYRGEFEEKLKSIISEATDNGIILFADEIHTIVGAGSAEGSVDASNILKPALARGDIKLIGATTPSEYAKTIMKDTALERRFRIINVSEPDSESCMEMLESTKKFYEKHHGIKVSSAAIREAVRIATRFMPSRRLPDKAVDLIDESSSEAVMRGQSSLDAETVDRVASSIIGIPKEILKTDGVGIPETTRANMSRLFPFQKSAIDGAVAALDSYIRGIRGKKNSERPTVLTVTGPKGSGKSYFVSELLKSPCFSNRINIDMTCFSDFQSLRCLTGTSAYGRDDGEPCFTEKIIRNPYSAVVIENFDTAYPDVKSAFMRLSDDGFFCNGDGKPINFSAVMLIFITESAHTKSAGFSEQNEPRDEVGYPVSDTAIVLLPPDKKARRFIAEKIWRDRFGDEKQTAETAKRIADITEKNLGCSATARAINEICDDIIRKNMSKGTEKTSESVPA